MRVSNVLISGLCVTKDRPAFLERAIAWWRAQTWPRKELVIVDGSRRDLRLDLSAARDIRHVILEPDLEMGAKHDRAIAEAQGDVVTYYDDDDYRAPRCLLKQLEPIALDRATVTGVPRDLIVHVPGASFFRFKRQEERGNPREWIGNGVDRWKGKAIYAGFGFHDGTAMFTRSALSHGIKHKAVPVGQKVDFINAVLGAGEKHVDVRNEQLFVYVRHAGNTWRYRAWKVETPVAEPSWVPDEILAFWKKGAAA